MSPQIRPRIIITAGLGIGREVNVIPPPCTDQRRPILLVMATHYSGGENEDIYRETARLFGYPKEDDFLSQRHIYEGFVFTNMTPPETLDALKGWETREDDIFVVTYPKSGTHWMWEIVFLLLARGQPDKIDRSKMTTVGVEMMYPFEFKDPAHEVLAKMESPRAMVTHLNWHCLPKQVTEGKKGKIVYVMRNPKDVVASISRFVLDHSGAEKDDRIWKYILNSFLRGENIYGHSYSSWFDHVNEYWQNRNNGNVFFACYEEMKKDFQSVLTPLSTFILGEELDEETRKAVEYHSSMKGMKKSYDRIEEIRPDGVLITKALGKNSFIQKRVIGSWKDLFTVAENEKFDAVCKEKMANRGFKIIYA